MAGVVAYILLYMTHNILMEFSSSSYYYYYYYYYAVGRYPTTTNKKGKLTIKNKNGYIILFSIIDNEIFATYYIVKLSYDL